MGAGLSLLGSGVKKITDAVAEALSTNRERNDKIALTELCDLGSWKTCRESGTKLRKNLVSACSESFRNYTRKCSQLEVNPRLASLSDWNLEAVGERPDAGSNN